jgi:flagellar biosynthesis/type III secretory pathway chaperone
VKDLITQLIEALRQELQQYGEMLARLDQQQDSVLRRSGPDVLDTAGQIEAQGSVIATARAGREQARARLATALGLPDTAAFAEMLPRLPEEYRPLVRALVEENNELIERVQRRSRQNHLLLSRTVELMQKLLGSLFQTGASATYNGAGNLLGLGAPARSLYEAVG